jgi:hypothetical protein
VLSFIQAEPRRVHRAWVTAHPRAASVAQQARNAAMHFAEQADRPRVLLRDHDYKFTRQFDEILQAEGVQVKAVGERWVQGVKRGCLDRSAVFGEAHLRDLV